MSGQPLPVLIDTDIGDDIDDALALAFALHSPELDVRAITTVFGDVAVRSQLALKLLDTFGRPDIPVGTGRGQPLLDGPPAGSPNQAAVLDGASSLPQPSSLPADELILRTADACDGQLTLITIGAMTNMAVALLRDPSLAERARLIVMGGVVSRQQAEWNIRCDPEAARVCFDSGIPTTLVGLDVTLQCQLALDDVQAIADSSLPTTALLSAMIRAWQDTGDGQRKRGAPILHDPLAVAVAFRPDLVSTQTRRIRVETRGEFTRGYTIAQDGGPAAAVCTAVDAEAFVGLFMDRILGEKAAGHASRGVGSCRLY